MSAPVLPVSVFCAACLDRQCIAAVHWTEQHCNCPCQDMEQTELSRLLRRRLSAFRLDDMLVGLVR